METKNQFSSKIGFILAAAGSAVGLGNLWRFPYLAARHGGGSFLLIYIILAVTFGFALMVTEIAIGRKTGKSPLYAYTALNKKSGFIGILTSIVPILILPYYCVIGGWVIKYTAVFLFGEGKAAVSDSYFSNFISQTEPPIFWLFIFVFLTLIVILMGVNKGIENVSKIMMPVLILLSIGIAIYVVTRPGSLEGVLYYLKPDFSKITVSAIIAASGQIFYSMSLAMGIMITYGSYTDKRTNIESSVRSIEVFDTLVAFLAGLMIVPAVYMFSGGDQEALTTGPTLMFITLPKVFDTMAGGQIIGAAFFILVLFAALTSSISLMETVVSIIIDKFHTGRRKTVIGVGIYVLLMAIPSSLGFGAWSHISLNGMTILDMFDFLTNSLIMPVVCIMTCIFVGYIIKPKVIIDEVESSAPEFKSKKFYIILIKYVAPVLLALIFASSVIDLVKSFL